MSSFLFTAWDWNAPVVAGCLALLAGYAVLVRRDYSARAIAWVGAIALLFLALLSPLDALADHYLFFVHMAKHILFVLVVPALLLIGIPPEAAPPILRRVTVPPAASWLAGIGVMAVWHIPVLFNAALASEPLHAFEHLSLLAGGTLYWWPILSPVHELRLSPVPQAAGYLFTSCLACTSMGIVLTFAPTLLYPAYAHPADVYGILATIRNQWGISPALDQQIGGLLMWVPCCFVYLAATLVMFARWYGEERSESVVEA